MVRRIASNDAGDDRPRSEQPSGEGRQLVRSLGVVLGMDQLAGRVFGVEIGGCGGQLGVSDEAAVVDAPREVQSRVGLEGVADGYDGELQVEVDVSWERSGVVI